VVVVAATAAAVATRVLKEVGRWSNAQFQKMQTLTKFVEEEGKKDLLQDLTSYITKPDRRNIAFFFSFLWFAWFVCLFRRGLLASSVCFGSILGCCCCCLLFPFVVWLSARKMLAFFLSRSKVL